MKQQLIEMGIMIISSALLYGLFEYLRNIKPPKNEKRNRKTSDG